MTAYVYNEGGWRYLWGDTPDEALIAAAAVGHDLTLCFVDPWEAYALTEDQWVDAMIAGAIPTDRFGPAEWLAERRGDHKIIRRIDRVRTTGCA